MNALTKRLVNPEARPYLWLLAATACAVAPHLLRTPLWIPVFFLLLLGWSMLMHGGHQSKSVRAVAGAAKILFGLLIAGLVLGSYGTLTGRDAGVALLVLLSGLKLAELRAPRDYHIGACIGLFLLLTNFFYAQSLTTAVYTLCSVGLFLAALIRLNDPAGEVPLTRRLRLCATLLAQAAPIMLILFVLFPRIPGPLWGLPRDARSSTSGLDDQMSPGDISNLILSDEVALRVEFDGAPPKKSQLYWRGPVLWFTDGVKWVPDRDRDTEPAIETRGVPIRYTVTQEATARNWLFGLEMAAAAPARARFTHDRQIRARGPLQNRMRYALESYPDFLLFGGDEGELQRALQLPSGMHSRAVALARTWRDSGLDAPQLVERALLMFNEQKFWYTLTPPILLRDTVDEFLFETRQGFCEHYAASFVVLMRAAGVPARVVTGYLGGEINPVGNYLVVRQRDAHAWAEVWLGPGSGWVRIDPTGAVAPGRILEGVESALPDSILDLPAALQDSVIARDLWERFGYTWDAINNRWNQWVLGYDRNLQSLVLRRIGLGWLGQGGLVVAMTILVAMILVLVAVWLFHDARRSTDPARRLYDRFCARLARRGITRLDHEGPLDFAERAARRWPSAAAGITTVSRLYLQVRYGGRPELLPELRSAVHGFAPSTGPVTAT